MKAGTEKQTHVVAFRFGETPHQRLLELAAEHGTSPSLFARGVVCLHLQGERNGALHDELRSGQADLLFTLASLQDEVSKLRATWVKLFEHMLLNMTRVSPEDVRALVDEFEVTR